MATTTEPKFACAACGKQYAWKPELAGKKAKCKCGAAMSIPASVDEAAAPTGARAAAATASAPARSSSRSSSRGDGEPSFNDLAALAKGEIKDDAAYKCPWCGSPLEGKSTICASCKMNVKTGTKHDPKKAAKAAAKKKADDKKKSGGQSDQSAAKQIGSLIVVVILVGIAGLRIYRTFNKASNAYDAATGASSAPALDRDGDAVQMMQEMEPIEVRTFLDGNRERSLSAQWSNAQSKKYVDGWYNDYKPKKIWAFVAIISQQVIFELPDDKELRAKSLAWGRQWQDARNGTMPGKEDVGQKYMIIDTN